MTQEITQGFFDTMRKTMKNGCTSHSKFERGQYTVHGHDIDELRVWCENGIVNTACYLDGVEVFGTSEPLE